MRNHIARLSPCLLRAGILLGFMWWVNVPRSAAGPVTVVAGKLNAKEFGPVAVSGPGGSYAHVEAGPDMDPPADFKGKKKANDQEKIGKTDKQIIDRPLTETIGDTLKNTVGLNLQKKTALEVGRSIFYRPDESDDKVKEAKDNDGFAMLFARASLKGAKDPVASANQTVKVKKEDQKADQYLGEGTANAVAPGRGQFAAAIVNDPVVFQADSSTLDGAVTFTLGSALSLHVSEPGDLAVAAFEIMQDATTVLDFALKVSYGTTTEAQTLIPLDGSPSLLGSPSVAEYLDEKVLPFLSFDKQSRTLTATDDITLYRLIVPSDGTPVAATYNYVGLAGTTPEPSALVLLGTGALVLLGYGLRRRAD